MIKKAVSILKEMIPILIMVGCIPFVANDWILTRIYLLIIISSFIIKYEQSE